jgi:FixJ family two-component response regulator
LSLSFNDSRQSLLPFAFAARISYLQQVPLISIIDDDESVRFATRSLVRSAGLNARAFASAEEFLNSGCVTESSCIITDIQMPGLTGVELQCRLLAEGHRTPVIFITAFPNDSIRARVLAAGAARFLTKPFSGESLIQCLETILKQPDRASSDR